MQSPDNPSMASESVRKAVWLLMGVALNALELFIPRIPLFPWLKPGLANVITMIWIMEFGFADAILYTFIRIWISSFYFGFSPITFALSLSGGIPAVTVMGAAWLILGRRNLLGTVGLGITGAIVHNMGQLAAVYFMLTRNGAVFYQLPLMGIASLVFGTTAGAVTPVLLRILVTDKHHEGFHNRRIFIYNNFSAKPLQVSEIFIIFWGVVLLSLIDNIYILAVIAAAVTLTAFFVNNRKVSTIIYPLRFWPIFLIVGFIIIFFSYGKRIVFLSFVTFEGAAATAAQLLRLWSWLEAGVILYHLRCNELLFILLSRLFRRHRETLLAGLLSLEYFPAVLSFVKSREALVGLVWRNPLQSITKIVERTQNYIIRLICEKDGILLHSGVDFNFKE